MTRVEVVDASALAAIIFGEPEGPAVAARLEGVRLLAPTLLVYELTNVAVVKTRRHPALAKPIAESLAASARLPIELKAVDPAAVLALAQAHGLTAYDASYLWLAQTEGAGLVTLDRKLQAASQAP